MRLTAVGGDFEITDSPEITKFPESKDNLQRDNRIFPETKKRNNYKRDLLIDSDKTRTRGGDQLNNFEVNPFETSDSVSIFI